MIKCEKCKEEGGRFTERDGKYYCRWCIDEVMDSSEKNVNHERVPGCDNNPGG